MKALKLNHKEAQEIRSGRRSTWRLYDDKDITVNDTVELVDKVEPTNPSSWKTLGIARVTKIIQKQLGDVTEIEIKKEGYRSLNDAVEKYTKFYNREVSQDTPIKIVHFVLDQETSPLVVEKNTTDSIKEAKIFADGGSRGNPGPSASGFVILDMEGKVVVKKGVYLGITTNNQAEYRAVKLALEEAIKLNITSVHVYLDSLLVVNQMSGIFKVRNRDLWPIHAAIKGLTQEFQKITFTHVPRELNKQADAAVNEALDAVQK